MFAPFLPYCSEEAWSWWQEGSIHLASWPSGPGLASLAGPDARPPLLDTAAEVLVGLRRAKTEAKVSMRWPVKRCVVRGPQPLAELVELTSRDLVDAGAIALLDVLTDPSLSAISVEVELGEERGPDSVPES